MGPRCSSPLHDYQDFVTDRIKGCSEAWDERGMVSLPTGAGKTRVTVEAFVNAVRDGDVPTTRPTDLDRTDRRALRAGSRDLDVRLASDRPPGADASGTALGEQ